MGDDGKLSLRAAWLAGKPVSRETKQSRGQRLLRDVNTRNGNLPYIVLKELHYVKQFTMPVCNNKIIKLIHLPS
jgi:hypothetical protein